MKLEWLNSQCTQVRVTRGWWWRRRHAVLTLHPNKRERWLYPDGSALSIDAVDRAVCRARVRELTHQHLSRQRETNLRRARALVDLERENWTPSPTLSPAIARKKP